jgi:type II secretory pathway pseudopilin PulG
MGQQQLLLIVLSAIIVGIAIVVGINMFGSSAYQANQEAVLQDVVTIASRAQQWYRKPGILGGGDRTFTGINLTAIGFPDSTANGSYQLTNIGAQQFDISALGQEDGDGDGGALTVTVTVFPDSVGSPLVTP